MGWLGGIGTDGDPGRLPARGDSQGTIAGRKISWFATPEMHFAIGCCGAVSAEDDGSQAGLGGVHEKRSADNDFDVMLPGKRS